MINTTAELLACFDASAREYLCPFMESQGAAHSVGHCVFDGWSGPPPISKRMYQDLRGSFFWWINRFEFEHLTLDLGFGDREFVVEPVFYYPVITDHFAPWEILSAATVGNPHVASGGAWILSVDFMKKTIRLTSQGLIAHWDIFASPSRDMIDHARVARGKCMVFAQEEQRRLDRERASIQASVAFHSREYSEALRLLEPYRVDDDLSRSSAMLLRMVKRRME